MRKIDEILSEINLWKGQEISYKPLNGGLSNYTYLVTSKGVSYVLRVNGGQNDFLKLDKSEEIKAIQKAYELGIGAKIFTDESNTEYMITEFRQGQMISNEKAHDPAYIQKFAGILQKTHTISGINRNCSPFFLVHQYVQGTEQLNVKLPDGLDTFLRNAEKIEKRCQQNAKYIEKYCHNDFYHINILDDNGDLCLLDWELSGVGNIFFDLATISFSQAYSDEEDRLLLDSYFGYFEDEFITLMYDMKYMNMLREITWALMHSGMGIENINHEFNYYQSALWFLNRLKEGKVTT